MTKLFSIGLILLVAACAVAPKEEVITPQPYTYIDCINLGNPEQFCRDTASP